jgi:hypothetical protein
MGAKELNRLYKLQEIEDLIPAIADLCTRIKVFVLVDEIDRGWNASEDANAFVGGIIQASLELNELSRNLRVLVAIRRELCENIPLLYQDMEKYRDVIEDLMWDKPSLYRLITKRIRFTVPGLREFDDDRCWNCVFVADLEEGKSNSFEYIIDRTLCRPREVISFCSKALEVTREKKSWPIGEADIKEAEHSYSSDRVDDVAAEYRYRYPGLKHIFEAFRGKSNVLTREQLTELFRHIQLKECHIDESADWIISMNEESFLRVLWEIGFLQAQFFNGTELSRQTTESYRGSKEIGQINLRDVLLFRVSPMFHAYLCMKKNV